MRLELTHRGDYAIRAMIALSRSVGGRMSVRRIAEDMHIPVAFLPQLSRSWPGSRAYCQLSRTELGSFSARRPLPNLYNTWQQVRTE